MLTSRRFSPSLFAATLGVGSLVMGSLALGLAAPASADTLSTKVPSWAKAASTLGTAGSLWKPGKGKTAGLTKTRPITVLAEGLTFVQGAPSSGATFAGTRYGTKSKNFMISEKWADTDWAADEASSTSLARVGTVRIPIGTPGTQTHVRARVSANCFPQSTTANPRQIPAGYRCSQADVLLTGGVLEMTAKPPSTMTAPGTTSIVITTTGLTYAELVTIASNLQQVSGSGNAGAGSAQMRAMCEQMVDGKMSVAQASDFAVANGYTSRVGTINGVPQAVTMDYRWDRFTFSTVANAVAACTYG